MNPVITEHHSEIADLCRSHGVRQLEAFDPIYIIGEDPPGGPFEVAFAIEFVQDAEGFDQLDKLENLEADLGKVLNRRVHVSEISSIKQHTSYDPIAQKLLDEMEHVYG